MAKKNGVEQMKKDVKKLVSEISEIPVGELKDEALFTEELGIDSMKALEIVAAVEKKFKVIIPEEQIPTLRSLKYVYELIKKLLKL